ncbi:hypothetical protein [Nonomuraea sp. NPDC049709]|uniref:hypothetical protein n=1 Tax=Nonomuraea sp. NPDC049709 TaxID=3154736 RepID=UPI0034480296
MLNLPVENQWDLVVKHRIHNEFHGLWIEGDDREELSRLLRVDPDWRLECDLETATDMFPGAPEKIVWIGPHAPGWTQILAFGLLPYHLGVINLGRRRVFQIYCDGELDRLDPLYLYYDGEQLGHVTPPHDEGGYLEFPEYRPFANGLALGTDGDLERDAHRLLCMVGRITGRFLDQEWFAATRTLYRIPDGIWEEAW